MKETLKQKHKIWNGKTWFGLLGYTALATILYIFFVCVTADRKPRCYYLQAYGTGGGAVGKRFYTELLVMYVWI
jgi:hypothetical protein